MRDFAAVAIIIAVIIVAFAAALTDGYYMDIFILTCFYGTLAVAWNLMAGLTGLMSLGHALFVGIGAYSVAWGYTAHQWSPLVTWPIGIGLSIAVAIVIGLLCFRYGLKGYFFAIATLACGEIAFFAVSATTALGRSDGIILPLAKNPELHLQFIAKWPYGLMIGSFLTLTLLAGQFLMRSRIGYYWRSLRDNEDAAEALGVNAMAMKVLSFAISAGVASVCGAFYAHYVAFVDPRSVLGVDISVQLLVYAIVGGMGLLWGPLVGAAVLVPFGMFLRNFSFLQGSEVIFYAMLLIGLALVLPQGVSGWVVGRIGKAKAAAELPS